ncbi:MAG: flagellar motor protein MotB [Roseburia hominis]
MARRKEDPPKGSPAWMNTFADLMNLLLCFFVMLFSMSSVNEEKFEKVIASFQSTFSILPGGGASIGEGELISSGISQLENFDSYYNQQLSSQSDGQTEEEKDITEAYEQQELEESEDMAQQLENALSQYGIQDDVEVDFNAEYVTLNMNGALLFDSASAELRDEAYPLVNKLGKILVTYDNNIIEVEGHTDNVPIHSSKYEDNNVLSMYRALAVANYLRDTTTMDPAYIKSSGRGEYVPIADNATPEGRARNRRVEIKIYNSYNSNVSGTSTDDTGTETPADAALSTETVTDTPEAATTGATVEPTEVVNE